LSFFYILGIAFALALDAFTVATGLSLSRTGLSRLQAFRLSFFFGFFQFVMPLLGYWAGKTILPYIEAVDHWVAFGLLLLVGSKMIYEAFQPQRINDRGEKDPTTGTTLFFLSVATSLDALAVGLSFAVLELSILFPAVLIGIVAFVLSYAGAQLGRFLGRFVGRAAPVFGGIVLILIGIKILIEHI